MRKNSITPIPHRQATSEMIYPSRPHNSTTRNHTKNLWLRNPTQLDTHGQ